MIPSGYYIKARAIKDSWIAHAAPVVRETWDYLLREANHKDTKYMGFVLQRGQLFRSYHDIREALKWRVGYRFSYYSENQMKHTMKLLRDEGMIELTSQPRGNVITVLKYEEYQNPKNYESTSVSTDESTTRHPRINHPSLPINKNVKNEKNVRKENTTIVEVDSPTTVYGNEDINWVVEEFEIIFGMPSQGDKRKDRNFAKHLIKNYDRKQLTYMMKYCATHEYAPRVGSIEKLWYKRADIIAGIQKLKPKTSKVVKI